MSAKFDRVEAAKRYAAADRSDPFAFSRAMTHLNNGVASTGEYEAEETTETRHLPEGIQLSNGDTSYQVVGYKNVKRP